MRWWAIGGSSWLAGLAMRGIAEEEAKCALEANAAPDTSFPTTEQADAIEGYRQVGPC